jgi:glycosyltransferase involved in cell wall biosynthesis
MKTSSTEKSILIISNTFLPNVGGTETFSCNLAQTMMERGYKIYLLTTNIMKLDNFTIIDHINIFRLSVYSLSGGHFPIILPNIENYKILKKILGIKHSLIIINMRIFTICILGALIGKLTKTNTIIIDHIVGHADYKSQFKNIIGHMLEHIITSILKFTVKDFYGVSKANIEWLKHFNIKAKGIIYNGIRYNTNIINKLSQKNCNLEHLEKTSEQIIISFFGRLITEKGIMNLIEAFEILQIQYDNLKLIIGGEGYLHDQIVLKSNLNNQILYLGIISNESVLNYLEITDILVLPSNFPESLPTILLEAGLKNCAVIATPQGSVREIIPGSEYGIIIENNSVKTIKVAIESLIVDQIKIQKLGENLNKHIIENFEWTKISESIEVIISKSMK